MSSIGFYVYIITKRWNAVMYIGVTRNLLKRIYQYKHKLVKGFSAKYNVNKLVYYEICEDPQTAIKREKQLKNLLRKKKEALINKFNPEWRDLYEDIAK